MPCRVCGERNVIFTYCREHFVDAWWRGEALKDDKPFPGMPEVDLRNMNTGKWEFSVCVIISDPDYLSKSAKFTINKMTKGKIYRTADRPNTGMGHSYVRFKSPKRSRASRDHMTFGMMANGVECPDGEAGKNPLQAELAIDYRIDDEQKTAICETIGLWLAGHIMGDADYRYDIMSSNCTRFARDCCDAAKIYFPGSRLPSYSNSSGWNLTHTPGKLFGAMSKSKYAYDPIRDRSPGTCPTGYMGFQINKRSRGDKVGSHEFRKAIERFKADTGVRDEGIAVQFMALVSKGVISKDDLIGVLAETPADQALKALLQID